jgi:flavodoxin/formate hydrogenlyase subunit 6/NADH:ubiquinone oxidoreductase subunit I
MNPLKAIPGRRQFMIASAVSLMTPAFGRIGRALGADKASDKQGAAKKKAIKGCIVYYSATGSTAKAAKAIYNGMSSVIDCDIFSIKKAKARDMAKYDVIALGTPIWYNRETLNMDLFILEMPNMIGKLCIPFCTHGVGPNGYMYNMSRAIHKRGMTIIGWADWYGSVFHVLHQPKPYHTDGHPDKVDLAEAEAFGKAMGERAQKIFDGQTDLIPEIPHPDSDTIWKPQKLERAGAMADMMGVTGGAGGPAGGQPGGMPGDGVSSQQVRPGGGAGQGPGQAGPAGNGVSQGQSTARGMGMSTMGTGYYPVIDLTKCVYPRCRSCMDVCVQNAIDLTRIIAQPGLISGADVLVKSACIQCKYPECQRGCKYEAIIYKSATTQHDYDMKKCTYPKCTLCIDNCLMDSIYVSEGKLMARNNCEGCDVCYCICPTGAVTIPNLADTVHAGAVNRQGPGEFSGEASGGGEGRGQAQAGAPGGAAGRMQGAGQGQGGQQGRPGPSQSSEMSGAVTLQPGATNEAMQNVGGSTANLTGKRVFRRLVSLQEVGKYYGSVIQVKHRPILELKEDDWPIMKDKNGNIIPNDYNS